MRQEPRPSHFITGVAAMVAVVVGFAQSLLTSHVPRDWRPFAWIAIVIAVALQLGILSQPYRDWFLNSLYALLGFPIGIAINLMVADSPSNIKQILALAIVGAFFVLMLVGAALWRRVRTVSNLRASVWGTLAASVPVFWGIAAGAIGSIQTINNIIFLDGPKGYGPHHPTGSIASAIISILVVPSGLVPLIGSFFASWMCGHKAIGVRVALFATTLVWIIPGVYFWISSDTWVVLFLGIIVLVIALPLLGWPAGLIGGYLGAGIRRLGDPAVGY